MKRTPLARGVKQLKRSGFKTKLATQYKNVSKGQISANKTKPKSTRAKKMGQKKALLEKYNLPQIPCSRWGTAKRPTDTDLLRGMLWYVFSKHIRERDAYKNCITCSKPLDHTIQAGHYVPVGDSSVAMWFREDNVHGEHANCNADWNAWHLVPMRKNMVTLYGAEHIEEMDSYAGRKNSVDWSEQDYVDRIRKYMA